jgi:elongation factor P
MISSNDFKKGIAIKLDGELYTVIDFQHVKPGKGGAFVRTKLRSVKKQTVIERTFRAGEKVEDAVIDNKQMQYLYKENESLVFMDTESYDQESISKELVGDFIDFIKEGDLVQMSTYEDKPISIDPPTFVNLKVVYAEPGIKGDTATNVQKPVKVETGAQIYVPLFVNEGDTIKIDTRKGEYVERVKL